MKKIVLITLSTFLVPVTIHALTDSQKDATFKLVQVVGSRPEYSLDIVKQTLTDLLVNAEWDINGTQDKDGNTLLMAVANIASLPGSTLKKINVSRNDLQSLYRFLLIQGASTDLKNNKGVSVDAIINMKLSPFAGLALDKGARKELKDITDMYQKLSKSAQDEWRQRETDMYRSKK